MKPKMILPKPILIDAESGRKNSIKLVELLENSNDNPRVFRFDYRSDIKIAREEIKKKIEIFEKENNESFEKEVSLFQYHKSI